MHTFLAGAAPELLLALALVLLAIALALAEVLARVAMAGVPHALGVLGSGALLLGEVSLRARCALYTDKNGCERKQ